MEASNQIQQECAAAGGKLKRNLSFVKTKREMPPSKEELEDPLLNLSKNSTDDTGNSVSSPLATSNFAPISSVSTTILMGDTDQVVKYVIKKSKTEEVKDSDALTPTASIESPRLSVTNAKRASLKNNNRNQQTTMRKNVYVCFFKSKIICNQVQF